MHEKMRKAVIVVLCGIFIYSCTKVPVTGRRQLSLISNAEIIPLSFKSYKQVIDTSKLSDNQEQVAMLKRVGNRIKIAVEEYMEMNGLSDQLQGFEWEFNLIDADVVNAWAMPGGKVAFYTGIMSICKDENGIAVVMGHEVAHAIANHGRERMSTGLLANIGLSSVSLAMGQNPTLTQRIFMQSIGMGTQIGMLKFSRAHESEADRIGLIFRAMGGYDPAEAPKFWQRMDENTKKSGGEGPAAWLSTHPSHEKRIADLQAQIPEAMEYYKKR